MGNECLRIRRKASPKSHAILATRGFYNIHDLIAQFKTHVWCHLEFSIGAIFHAADSHLQEIDGVQQSFCRSLDLTEEHAFLSFNFAPLCLRRDIAVLGLLHKITFGHAHEAFVELFPLRSTVHVHEFDTRQERRRHHKQFVEHNDGDKQGISVVRFPPRAASTTFCQRTQHQQLR